MRILNWNYRRVQNLSPWEIWLFIAGRVFIGFGVGVFAMQYFPRMARWLGVPALVAGLVLLILAFKGFLRNRQPSN
jgi:Na+/proline symporter